MSKQLLLAAAFVAGLATTSSAQCLNQFYDGFETGAFSPNWVPGTGNYTNTVPSGSAPAGTYHLSMQSNTSNSFYQGLSATFTSGQPGYMSWWMRTNTTNAANGYVVIGDANIASDNGVLFCYFNATSGLRFFNTTGYNHPITANTWYFVECRNMNWTSRTMDIYVNNALILTGWAFRSPSATSIDRIHLHSLSAAIAQYDDFTIGNPAVTASMSFTSPSCFGGTNGTASVVGGGGTGALTYSWAPSGGTGTTEINLAAGTYSCTVTDAIGCTTVGTVTLTEPTAVTATTMQTNVSCNGGNDGDAMVMPTGGTPGYTYSWAPSGGTGATATGLAAGVYTCTITDANGCTAVQTVNITEPALLSAVATNSGDICVGDSAMLNAINMGGTPNYSFNWLPGNLPGAMVNVSPAATTTYTIEITDGNGCTATHTTTVVVNALPTVNLGPDTTVCGGIVLDAQNSGSTYLWNDNSNQQVLNAGSSGMYAVTVTDANGCSASDTVNVTVDATPSAGVVQSTGGVDVCPGDSIALVASGASGTIDWWVWLAAAPFWQQVATGNPFAQVVALADTGTYQFMAIASNGVCAPDTSNIITVTVRVPPVVMLSDTVACGSSVVLDAGNSGSTYLWSDNSTQQQLAVNASGMYSVVVTDQYGCMGSDSANVTLNQNPAVTGTATSITPCLDDANVTLTGMPTPGTWSGPGVTGNSFDPSVGTGPQILTYTHTDSNGCTGQFLLTVNVNACVGIAEQDENSYSVYPNPNNGMFNLALNTSAEKLLIEITDLQGRIVYTSALSNVQNGNVIAIDVADVAAGNYIMHIAADGSVFNREIIITK